MFLPKGLTCPGWAPLPFPGCCELGPRPPALEGQALLPSALPLMAKACRVHRPPLPPDPPPLLPAEPTAPGHVPRGGHGLRPASG